MLVCLYYYTIIVLLNTDCIQRIKTSLQNVFFEAFIYSLLNLNANLFIQLCFL